MAFFFYSRKWIKFNYCSCHSNIGASLVFLDNTKT